MDWQQESEKRLIEAARLRKELAQLGHRLLELRTQERLEQSELNNAGLHRDRLSESLWLDWVKTPAAQERDPVTGKMNEQWRRRLWQNARLGNAHLVALEEAVHRCAMKHHKTSDEIARLQDEMAELVAQMDMLRAELGSLAALMSQGGKPGA